jgi:hypothetical protein
MSGFVDDFIESLEEHVDSGWSSNDKTTILKRTVETLYPNTKVGQPRSVEHVEAAEWLEAVCATLGTSARSHNGQAMAYPNLGSFFRAALNGLRRGLGLNAGTDSTNNFEMYPSYTDDSQQSQPANVSSEDDDSDEDEDSDEDDAKTDVDSTKTKSWREDRRIDRWSTYCWLGYVRR